MATISCPRCDKTFKTERGLTWHVKHVHEVETVNEEPGGGTREVSLEQRGDHGDAIERLHGLELQFAALEEQLEGLVQQVSTASSAQDGWRQRIERTQSATSDTVDRLAKKVREGEDKTGALETRFHDSLSKMDSRIDQNTAQIGVFDGGVHGITQRIAKLESQVRAVQSLYDRMDKVEQGMSRLGGKLSAVEKLAVRQPTGKLVTVALSDGREHTFKEYRSREGLIRPRRHSHDLILGDRWIDLED